MDWNSWGRGMAVPGTMRAEGPAGLSAKGNALWIMGGAELLSVLDPSRPTGQHVASFAELPSETLHKLNWSRRRAGEPHAPNARHADCGVPRQSRGWFSCSRLGGVPSEILCQER